ncbi:MAG TPA: 4-alpha-glucanotransferase [Oscillospiraceae bacterium]|nr:4-alpha-glucanotransferase [Oscillospiraceae bacterium]
MPTKSKAKPFVRGAGILLPITALPSNYGIGTLGASAYEFIDFLKAAGQKYWQVLPVGPTSFGDSPYQSFSAFAGNPYFIDFDLLIEKGLFTQEDVSAFDWGENPSSVDYAKIFASRFQVLQLAFQHSKQKRSKEYQAFCTENSFWLQDYSLYMALKFHFKNQEWLLWPEDIRLRNPQAIRNYEKELKDQIDFWKFCQFQFYEQWANVKSYAKDSGIQIIGDIPIYVALDSADVWTATNLFQLDESGHSIKVAGVPPDAFCESGQLWGNPLYDWQAMEKEDFAWWKRRMAHSAKLYDIIRIDHFIGAVQYYAIPAGDKTAENGAWQVGPGQKLTDAINSAIGNAKVIAEDLGVSLPAVKKLLKKTGYPSMKIIQFAFDGNPKNEHLPYNYTANMAVYGGTHDNETLAGYFSGKKTKELKFAMSYLNVRHKKEIPWAVIRTLYQSVANTVLFQAQDILELPNSARMNFPSTIGTNWCWRLENGQLTAKIAKKLKHLTQIYGR